MQAFFYTKYGKPNVDTLGELPRPEEANLKEGQMLLEVHATSLNPIDYKQRRGDMKLFFKMPLPQIHGFDFAGRVVAKSADVSDFNVDDMVFGLVKAQDKGACAEYLVVDAGVCVPLPENIAPAEAACVCLVGGTAMLAFRRGGLQENDESNTSKRVLVLGGAGGVGSAAIQLAKGLYHCGFVATTASPGAKTDLCKDLGADLVINYREDPKFTGLKEVEPFDIIFDTVGSAKDATPYVQKEGTIVSIVSPAVEGLRPYLSSAKDQWAFGVSTLFFSGTGKAVLNWALGANKIRSKIKSKKAQFDFIGVTGDKDLMIHLRAELVKGTLKAVIDKSFPLSQAKQAMEYLESGKAAGKVVITVREQ